MPNRPSQGAASVAFRIGLSLTVAGPCRTCTGLPFYALVGSLKPFDCSTDSQHERLSPNRVSTSGIIKRSRAMTNPPITLAGVTLHSTETFSARRMGRYILVELLAPHRVLSTSAHCGGQREDIGFLANHQSCEAQGDTDRQERIATLGLVEYHREVCREIGVDPDHTALMGTAANMSYACHRWAEFEGLRADALVTAGVSGNAARAGDPAQWNETESGWRTVSAYGGTINTILLLNCPLTAAALIRSVITMTEAKSAALAETRRSEPVFPDDRNRHGNRPVLPRSPARPGKDAKEFSQPPCQARRDHWGRRQERGQGGVALAERVGAVLHTQPLPCAWTFRPD